MALHESLGVALLATSVLLVIVHAVKMRRERVRPTLRHSLFASHLTSVLHRSR